MKKLTINRIASAALRTNRKSYAALMIGIFLSIFLVASMCLGVHGLFMANEARRDARLGSQDAFWLYCEETDETLMATGLYSAIGHVYIPAVHNDTATSVGYYDEAAAAYLNRTFIEGRMPQAPGEIAMEDSALARLRLENVGVGDALTLTLTPVDGAEEVRTFTLVGVMENQSANMQGYADYTSPYMQFPAMLIHQDDAAFATGRMVQHKLFTFAPGVTGYQALLHYVHNDEQGHRRYGELQIFDGNDNPTSYPSDLLAPNPAVFVYSACIALLAGSLLLATCVGIAGAMESQLSRKTEEIGMLRAVGATKRQIRRIFGREALLLALIVSPLAILAGCGAAWALSLIAPTVFVFKPAWWLLLPVLLLSMVTILLASGLPLRRASRVMPMSVMRDTEMLRKLRRIRPKKVFHPANLVAWRQLNIRPGRQVAPALLMSLMMIVVSMTMYIASNKFTSAISDLTEQISFNLWCPGRYSATFYDQTPGQPLTTGDIAQLRKLPGVKRVEIVAGGIRVLQELDGELPEYWTPRYYEMEYNGYAFTHNLSNGHRYLLPADERPDDVPVTSEAEYETLRSYLGIDVHLSNSIQLDVCTIDPEELERYVVSGDIDLAAINAGQEVLVVAPTIYSFLSADGAINTYRSSNDAWLQRRLSSPDFTLLAAIENDAYTAGQQLTLHYVHSDTVATPAYGAAADYLPYYQQMEHETTAVTVGAVLDGGFAGGDMVVMVTTEQGLANMGFPLTRVSSLNIYTGHLTLEEEAALEKRITSIAMRGADYEVNNNLAMRRDNEREITMTLLLMGGVSLILLTVCIAQITGSVSRRIRAEVRMIGTLRAVGADERVIFRIYSGQVAMSVLIGAAVGLVFYWCVIPQIPYIAWIQAVGTWLTVGTQAAFAAATLLASLAILRLRIRDVTHHSIVENIREL